MDSIRCWGGRAEWSSLSSMAGLTFQFGLYLGRLYVTVVSGGPAATREGREVLIVFGGRKCDARTSPGLPPMQGTLALGRAAFLRRTSARVEKSYDTKTYVQGVTLVNCLY